MTDDDHGPLEIDLDKIESVALRRLVEEVRRGDDDPNVHLYDRIYNRHNRS